MCNQNQDVTYPLKEESRFTLSRAHEIFRRQELPSRMFHRLVKIKPASDSGDNRNSTDDYFPLGEEYEDELGHSSSDQVKRIPARKSSHESTSHSSLIDTDHDYFLTASSPVSGEPKLVFINSLGERDARKVTDCRVRNMSGNDAYEKLQALQKKVEEFKQKLFRLRGDDPETKHVPTTSPMTEKPEKGGSKSSGTTGGENFIQNGQVEMLCIAGESDCDDCPSVKNKTVPCQPPNDPGMSTGQSANQLKRKKEKKTVCVKCPPKKPSKLFSSVANGAGTERAEPGGDVFSSTQEPIESRTLGGGSKYGFLVRMVASRSGEAALHRSLISALVPSRDITRRFYGNCGNGSKGSKKPVQPCCPEPKKTPACPSPSTPPAQPCPPSKVKFRKCPSPPKLPELPKCPPPCAPPPPPPVPKCPAVPKCPPPCPPPDNSPKSPTSPPCLPPKKKCSGRQMSTYSLIHGIAASKSFRKRYPVFLVARRRVSSSSANFASNSNSEKNCDDQKGKKTENKCLPDKSGADRCAKSKKRNTKGARDCRGPKSVEKCPSGCDVKPRCPPLPPPPPPKPGVEWSPPICAPPKLVGPSPCPELPKEFEDGQSQVTKPTCPPPPPLPKPPCQPVCLCPCPPPPKVPPGSCPDVPSVEDRTEPSCLPPCPPKLQPPCPKETQCPSKPICPSKK